MVRMQVQFTEQQVQALRNRAHTAGRSMADLVREAVRGFLAGGLRLDREELTRRAREIRGSFRSGIPDLAQDHDRHLADGMDP